MSRYLHNRFSRLEPYVPGEQPRDMEFIKLNTNELPFPPSPRAVKAASKAAERMRLYSDPESHELRAKLAGLYGISPSEVICANGSDELLYLAIMGFCGADAPAVFPDVTYSFYKVIADLNCVPYIEIPVREDLSVDVKDYVGVGKTVVIANPNAPTGLALEPEEIEEIVVGNPDNVVVVDEAYVDFGGKTCLPMIEKYDNLLIVRTFSKSRAMAGARLGYGMAAPSLIADLNTLRDSFTPYNMNLMTTAAGIGAIEDEEYTQECCGKIIATREKFTDRLLEMGFSMSRSNTNFVFARHGKIGGAALYGELRARGILVRHFSAPKLDDYIRISIGTDAQMERLAAALEDILEGL